MTNRTASPLTFARPADDLEAAASLAVEPSGEALDLAGKAAVCLATAAHLLEAGELPWGQLNDAEQAILSIREDLGVWEWDDADFSMERVREVADLDATMRGLRQRARTLRNEKEARARFQAARFAAALEKKAG